MSGLSLIGVIAISLILVFSLTGVIGTFLPAGLFFLMSLVLAIINVDDEGYKAVKYGRFNLDVYYSVFNFRL
jgi:hypothetical protein